jgi:2-polyprenyl-6-methoxyphenol hydroxylase-like FAD-dependent oxidoreductase
MRGQLSRILYDYSLTGTNYLFDNQITALRDDGYGVSVEFLRGPARRFDVVVIAEGLRSRTRSMVFPGARVHELGLYSAYLTIPRTESDNDRWRWLVGVRGRTVSLRPDNVGTTRASLGVLSQVRGLERLARAEVVAVLRATFADVGWETPRILDALDEALLYVESFGQVRLPSWSTGRIGMLGDAAYCPSPDSGLGTTLALTGAYILAGELTGQTDPRDAFARYEAIMRPMVTRAQQLGLGVPRIEHPYTRWERSLFWARLRAKSNPLVRAPARLAGAALHSAPADTLDPPDYHERGGVMA